MPKYIKNAKIALLDFSLQKIKMKMGVQMLISNPDNLEEMRKRFDNNPIDFEMFQCGFL